MNRILPLADDLTAPFWASAERGELVVQRCVQCARYQFPPRPICVSCHCPQVTYEPVSGEARLHSWTVTHHKIVAGLESQVPYLCLLVELAEQDGLFMLSDRIGEPAETSRLRSGMAMQVEFQPVAPGVSLPQFRPLGQLGER